MPLKRQQPIPNPVVMPAQKRTQPAAYTQQSYSILEPDYGNQDTIACKIDGWDESGFQSIFEALPGFLALKFNSKANSCFVKFASAELALNGLSLAHESSITAQFARRSLELGGELPANYIS